jgi:hypothetical protein
VVYLHYLLEMTSGRYILLQTMIVLANSDHIQRVKALSVRRVKALFVRRVKALSIRRVKALSARRVKVLSVSDISYRRGVNKKVSRLSQN